MDEGTSTIFDIMDGSRTSSDYDPAKLIPFILLEAKVDPAVEVFLDQNCLEKTNFRQLSPHSPYWFHEKVTSNQLRLLEGQNQTLFKFAVRITMLDDKSKMASGLAFIVLKIITGETFLFGIPINKNEYAR